MKRLTLIAAHAALLLLAACGGGNNDQALPIQEGSPEAYTMQYLNEHPNVLIQPEHLIIVRVDPQAPDGGRQSARLHIREPMTLSLGSDESASALSEVSIEDASGVEQLHHKRADEPSTATLVPGSYRIVIQAAAGLAKPQTLFLKLADTPAQTARRQQAMQQLQAAPHPVGRLLGAAPAGWSSLGLFSGNTCMPCSFDNADLTNADLSNTFLGGATFNGTTLFNTNFTNAYCYQRAFDVYGVVGATNFTNADLNSTRMTGNFGGVPAGNNAIVKFNGASIQNSVLALDFRGADFSPSTERATNLHGTDLSHVLLWFANLQYADLSNTTLASDESGSTFFEVGYAKLNPNAFLGVNFDDALPANMWAVMDPAGMDLTGASFAGIDLSQLDLSVANGVKVSAAGLVGAILSNGTTGTNLAGQDVFPTPFIAWAGTVAVTTSGKDLRYVNLSGINLSQADLTRANLAGANLIGTDLSYANLYAASLRGAQLGVAPGSGTQAAADLSNAYMPYADLTDADLRSVSLANVHLYGADDTRVSFQRARLDSASFVSAYLMQADFTQASLNDTDFSGAVLINAGFDAATLSNTKFSGAYLQGANFATVGSMTGLRLDNAVVATAADVWKFTEFDKTSTTFQFQPTALGSIASATGAVCPNGASSPCTADKLTPIKTPPYPVVPKCTGLRKYDYKNCDPGWTPPAS